MLGPSERRIEGRGGGNRRDEQGRAKKLARLTPSLPVAPCPVVSFGRVRDSSFTPCRASRLLIIKGIQSSADS